MRSRIQLSAVCLGLLFALADAPAVWGVTFAVNTFQDGSDIVPGDGACDRGDGTCTLRAAVQEANALAGSDTIVLQAGKHSVVSQPLGIADDVDIAGPGATLCTVRGKKRTRVIHIATGAHVTLSGMTIEGGFAEYGGAILNEGSLQMTQAVVRRSQARSAAGLGGGIYNDGTLELSDVTMQHNRALGSYGGLGGSLYNNGTATLQNVRINRSRATGCGGAIFNNLGSIDVTDTLIDRNRVKSSGGGLFHQQGTMTLNNVTVSRNRANSIGGGIFTYGTLFLTNVSITKNRGHIGGGLFSRYTPIADLLNVTLSYNRAHEGGGIMNNGTVTLKNTIVAGNKPNACEGTAVTSSGHNLVSDASCALGQPGDLVSIDPMLGPLIDDGITMMHALLPGSPAIDAGDDSGAPGVDQRGASRPADGDGDNTAISDIGAYELQP